MRRRCGDMRENAGKCGPHTCTPPPAPLGQGWGKVRVGAWCAGARARSNHRGGPSWDDGVPVKSRSGLLRTQGRWQGGSGTRHPGSGSGTRGGGQEPGEGRNTVFWQLRMKVG